MKHPDNSINSQLLLKAISIQLLETRHQNDCFPQTKKKKKERLCLAFPPPTYRACRWVKINIPVYSCSVQKTLTECLNCPRRMTSDSFFFYEGKKVFSIRYARKSFPTSETITKCCRKTHLKYLQTSLQNGQIVKNQTLHVWCFYVKINRFFPFAMSHLLKTAFFTYLLFVLYSLILSRKSFWTGSSSFVLLNTIAESPMFLRTWMDTAERKRDESRKICRRIMMALLL